MDFSDAFYRVISLWYNGCLLPWVTLGERDSDPENPKSDRHTFEVCDVTSGVTWGTILGPLLLLLNIASTPFIRNIHILNRVHRSFLGSIIYQDFKWSIHNAQTSSGAKQILCELDEISDILSQQ